MSWESLLYSSPFAIIHSNPAVKKSVLPSFAICHPELNDTIAKLSYVDKVYMLYTCINHSKEVYMANMLPEIEVRGSLQQIYPEPKVRGISNCKLSMTEVEGSMIHDIHHLTMVHIIYTIVRGQIT